MQPQSPHASPLSEPVPGGPAGPRDQSLVVDIAIRLAFIGLLAYWSLILIGPFLVIGLWGVILAVALYPTFVWVRARLGGHGGLAAALLTIALLVIVIGPASLLALALIENLRELAARIAEGTLRIPPPSQQVRGWPVVGESVFQFWTLASTNLAEALQRFAPQIRPVGRSLLAAAATAGLGILQFVAAVVIAGVLLAPAERLVVGIRAFAKRVVRKRGDHFIQLAGSTIRNVARGVIGVSLLQSLLIGIGLLVAGVPAAGLVTMAALVLGILQIGPGIVVLAAIAWAWSSLDAAYALVFTAYMIPVTLLDNFLKPIVMAHGLSTPMIVILIGVLGGTLAHGLIGLFVGPVVLAVAYDLLLLWVRAKVPEEPTHRDVTAQAGDPAAQ